MRHLRSLLLLLLPLAPGCVGIASHAPSGNAPDPVLLKKSAGDDARQVRYELHAGGGGNPSIDRVSTRRLEVAQLGIVSQSLDKRISEERGLTPWRGVYVERVAAESAAKAAGIVSGDVLLSLDGHELTNSNQFQEVVESALAPGRVANVRLLRLQPNLPDRTWNELALELTPKAKQVEETTTDSFSLEAPSKLTRWTGLEIATVPAQLSRELWEKDASAALVTGVISGSAGYAGGFRGGDLVRRCNGQSVSDAASIQAAIDAGAEQLDLEVDGVLGAHRATIRTTSDSESKSRFHIPIIVSHTSRVDHSRTAFLDFIFQFGFTRQSTTYRSSTRAPNESSRLSILPFGMFEFERSPVMSKNTIFWFITWSTMH